MKTMTLDGFKMVKLSCPNAKIETRDGKEVVVVPTWDFNTDTHGEIVYLLDRGGETAPKFKPGDELTHTKTGSKFNVVDPFKAFLKLRKGPNADNG